MAPLGGPWRALLAVLIAVVVVTATLLALYAVPVKEVHEPQAVRFEFTLTQTGYWYYAPSGYPCPNNATSCTGSNFFAPPPAAIGPYLAAFSWVSDQNSTVGFEFFEPQCTVGTGPQASAVVLYSADSTGGGFAIGSNDTIGCDQAAGYPPVVSTLWWNDGPPIFVYTGQGPVTITGSISYTVDARVPFL